MLLHTRYVVAGIASLIAATGCGRSPDQVPYAVTIDIIECRPQYERECLYFYEHNWNVFREEARARNFISGYQLLRATSELESTPTLLLLTEYPDSLAFAQAEDNFQPMMRELRPDGPVLLNEIPRSEFVAIQTAFTTRPLNAAR